MSLKPKPNYPIPEETQRVAQAAFSKGNVYVRVVDAMGTLYHDEQFTDLFPRRGQPAASPARLALVTVLQYAEGLSDRQAADAVRGRIDWKYVLGLELTDTGFDHTVLSEFRSRLAAGDAAFRLLESLLSVADENGLVKTRGRQRTDSTHVLAAVRVLNRLERVGETLRATLNALAVVAPEWLQAFVPSDWHDRYNRRVENYHLPKSEQKRQALAATIGTDGFQLLDAIDNDSDLPWLAEVPAVKTLRRVWEEQYTIVKDKPVWRKIKAMSSPATLTASPYDPEARYTTKRSTSWVGYKVHLTETCDDDTPNLITHVLTTPATTPDDNQVAVIHSALAKRKRLPAEHLVDKGYTDAQEFVSSKHDYGVTLVGPVSNDPSWQARADEGYDKSQFHFD